MNPCTLNKPTPVGDVYVTYEKLVVEFCCRRIFIDVGGQKAGHKKSMHKNRCDLIFVNIRVCIYMKIRQTAIFFFHFHIYYVLIFFQGGKKNNKESFSK